MNHSLSSLSSSPARLARSGAFHGSVLLSLLACATGPAPPHTLETIKRQQVKQLVMQCYTNNEGLRAVHGDSNVYLACRNWAEAPVERTSP
jgi:hypothetical protein